MRKVIDYIEIKKIRIKGFSTAGNCWNSRKYVIERVGSEDAECFGFVSML